VTFFLGTKSGGICTSTPYVAPSGITVTYDQTKGSVSTNDVSEATTGESICFNARVNNLVTHVDTPGTNYATTMWSLALVDPCAGASMVMPIIGSD
jgi:hypothetical protein